MSRELSETPEERRLLAVAQVRLQEFYGVPVVLINPLETGPSPSPPAMPRVSRSTRTSARSPSGSTITRKSPAPGLTRSAARAGSTFRCGAHRRRWECSGCCLVDALNLADPEQVRLLETFAGSIGGALESTRMTAAAGRAEMMLEIQAIRPRPAPELAGAARRRAERKPDCAAAAWRDR